MSLSTTIRPEGAPFLPGNTFQAPDASKFHKSHALDFKNGVAIFNPNARGIAGNELESTKFIPDYSGNDLAKTDPFRVQRARANFDEYVPAYVAFDRMVLRFFAYFDEEVHESDVESSRIRLVSIDYYLEDGSISINEHAIENSGIPQGVFLRRHRVPRALAVVPGREPEFIELQDLNIGVDIDIYKRKFHIYDANQATKDYLKELGVEVGTPEPRPEDRYQGHRAKFDIKPTEHRTQTDMDKLHKFLIKDRQVLRFYTVWDDRKNVYGDIRELVLHYFLSDDTCEVLEVNPANCGRDPFPTFLRRQKLPKDLKNPEAGFVTEDDLFIGANIECFGRTLMLCDCDPFTRQYCAEVLNFPPEKLKKITIERPRAQQVEIEVPPPTGFGTDEDSLGSWKSLEPKVPKKDMKKMAQYQGVQLRFRGRMVTDDPVEATRRFVITFFPADDSVSVFEPPQRNSGIGGGKFLDRQKVRKTDGKFFEATDFVVGERVVINAHVFELLECDKYTAAFYEQMRNMKA
ncbi:Repeat of unknown function (DUF1126) [Carpediemonas membranifera]|uniref:DM10 domain-containing protein n=1 Tax=Carpediemonas membranifera TaxID=201153 RepID=A0A8J6AWZ2_9EUKA|nr:Repeat of unknown function (DUF1126) [Carpediemonas membranifera]|eukprot:KAG9394580.1 Repeat of unknown function (DUF1126) [Carpediemonas membranifera]